MNAEGRICAVQTPSGIPGIATMIQYVYDAEGHRVGKGTISQWSCNTDSNGFQLTNEYILGQSGEQVTELEGDGDWIHTNAFAGGQLIATYDSLGLHYHLTDWLGTRRMQVSPTGALEETCQSLPFGDQLDCVQTNSATSDDATEHHFTGKERDTESGLDYFGARYFGSSMGRFISPDPSGLAYAKLTNPQTLNLYSYVINNPLLFTDPTGLYCYWDDGSSDDDPQDGGASKKDCKKQGGTWTDQTNPCHGADGCSTTTTDDPTPVGLDDILDYQYAWRAGLLPNNIVYLQNSGWTTDLRNGPGVKAGINDYISHGCLDRGANDPFSPGHGAGLTTNLVQMETGDFNMSSSTSATPSGLKTTFTVTNTSGQASWSGANATGGKGIPSLSSDGTQDNPYGPNGPRHNVNQTFVWTQDTPCTLNTGK